MRAVEKIRNRERQTSIFYYGYEIKSISKDGEFLLNDKQLKGRYVFHYDDPKETELQEIEIVKDGAIRNFTFQGVPGMTHPDVKSRTLIFGLKGRKVKTQLEQGNDYEIEVGKRTMIESVQELTLYDIKDLGGK
ncbi:hypothetical protein G159_19925 [Planococcus glaciei CHR43]|uniref:hypothetical protein n=1 Tax=Planococcus glaciei TaxID=459472 RepID=UPI0003DF3C50|nr:hypothetical protein [Planococcus glaciei]ETP66938.1 hypothetical protein G159_19925 [Planococcus glaciei CHR43]